MNLIDTKITKCKNWNDFFKLISQMKIFTFYKTSSSIFFVFCLLLPLKCFSEVPANAIAYGSGWVCLNGYKKQGNECIEIDVPANAMAHGSGWVCNLGYKKQGSSCTEMTKMEKQKQIEEIKAYQQRQRNQTLNYDGEDFSLREIERKCEVYRYSDNYGDLECTGLRFIERKCEAYFYGKNENIGDIECRGSDLRPVERYCSFTMYSESYGDIDC